MSGRCIYACAQLTMDWQCTLKGTAQISTCVSWGRVALPTSCETHQRSWLAILYMRRGGGLGQMKSECMHPLVKSAQLLSSLTLCICVTDRSGKLGEFWPTGPKTDSRPHRLQTVSSSTMPSTSALPASRGHAKLNCCNAPVQPLFLYWTMFMAKGLEMCQRVGDVWALGEALVLHPKGKLLTTGPKN